MRENWDARILAGNDPRRLLRTRGTFRSQLWVVGADAYTDDEGAENVEEEDTPEDTPDGLGNVLPWVLGLKLAIVQKDVVTEYIPQLHQRQRQPFRHHRTRKRR